MTPLAGKIGRVQTSGPVNHEFRDWSLALNGNPIDVTGFETAAEPKGGYLIQQIVGLIGCEVTLNGRWNAAANKVPTDVFYVGATISSMYLGLTNAIGFTVTGIVLSNSTNTAVSDAANFTCRIHINSISSYPSI